MSSVFSRAVHALLEGKFICELTDEGLFTYLSDEASLSKVNSHLGELNYAVKVTNSGVAYYLVINDFEDKSATRAIKGEFERLTSMIKPVVGFIEQVMVVTRLCPLITFRL